MQRHRYGMHTRRAASRNETSECTSRCDVELRLRTRRGGQRGCHRKEEGRTGHLCRCTNGAASADSALLRASVARACTLVSDTRARIGSCSGGPAVDKITRAEAGSTFGELPGLGCFEAMQLVEQPQARAVSGEHARASWCPTRVCWSTGVTSHFCTKPVLLC
jgi:hypothetical protein